MSEYKTLRGGKVKNYTTNPDNPYSGQVWFNETEGELRVHKTTLTSAWATGNSMNTGRNYLAGSGTQTAALAFNGETPPYTTKTEAYDGTSWTEVNDMNVAKEQRAGAGVQTSSLCCGGAPLTAETESLDCTNWTEVSDLNTARLSHAQAGLKQLT